MEAGFSEVLRERGEADSLPQNQFRLLLRGDANVAFTFEFAAGSGGTATPGKDFLLLSAVSFAPGEQEKIVPITILDDGECEATETISLTLSCSNPSVVLKSALLELEDNEIPPAFDFNIRSEGWPANASIQELTSPHPEGGFIALMRDYLSPSNQFARYDESLRLVRVYPPFKLRLVEEYRGQGIGSYITTVHSLPNGGMLISGVFAAINGVTRPGLAAFTAEGTLDPAFLPLGESPALTPPAEIPGFRVLVVLRDGRILVLHGEENRLLMLLPNGAIDPAFDPRDLTSGVPLDWCGPVVRAASEPQAYSTRASSRSARNQPQRFPPKSRDSASSPSCGMERSWSSTARRIAY